MKKIDKKIRVVVSLMLILTGLPPAGRCEELSSPGLRQIMMLPAVLGKVQESFDAGPEGGAPVFLIEDAHGVGSAQASIRDLIRYIHAAYPLKYVWSEGSRGPFDSVLFKSFPSRELLSVVLSDYRTAGELAGAAEASIGIEGVNFAGMEDLSLYEKDIDAYLAALRQSDVLAGQLEEIKGRLNAWKNAHYQKDLSALDRAVEKFHEKNEDLEPLLELAAEIGARNGVSPRGEHYPVLAPLVQMLDEKKETAQAISREIEVLLGQVRSRITAYKERMEFNSRIQSYRTEQTRPEDLLQYLLGIAKEKGFALELSGSLSEHLARHTRITSADAADLFREMESYIGSLKSGLMNSRDEREADRLTLSIYLTRRFFSLELGRDDWNQLKQEMQEHGPDSSDGELLRIHEDFRALLERGPRTAAYYEFYETAEKREQAFLQRVLRARREGGVSILISGGFHTRGLAYALKEKKISYAVLTPAIKDLPAGNPYRSQMQGQVSWRRYLIADQSGRVRPGEAFASAASAQLLMKVREEGGEEAIPIMTRKWRGNLLARLTAEGRTDEAPRYLRFIDRAERNAVSEKEDYLRSEWLRKVDGFAAALDSLDGHTKPSSEKILQLFQAPAAAAWPTAQALDLTSAVPAPWLEGNPQGVFMAETQSGPDNSFRSEFRNGERPAKISEERWLLYRRMQAAVEAIQQTLDGREYGEPKRQNQRALKDAQSGLSTTMNLVGFQPEIQEEVLARAKSQLAAALAALRDAKSPYGKDIENMQITDAPAAVSRAAASAAPVPAMIGEAGIQPRRDLKVRSPARPRGSDADKVTALISAVSNASEKVDLAGMSDHLREISDMGEAAVEPLLFHLHNQPFIQGRIIAVFALGEIGPRAAAAREHLVDLSTFTPEPKWKPVNRAALWALRRIDGQPPEPVPFYLLDPVVEGMPPGDAAGVLIARLQKGGTDVHRLKLLEQIRDVPGSTVVSQLTETLTSTRPVKEKIAAALLLGTLGKRATSAVETLRRIRDSGMSQDGSWNRLKLAARWAVARINERTSDAAPVHLLGPEAPSQVRSERSEVRHQIEGAALRRALFHDERLELTPEMREAILSLIPAPILEELRIRGTRVEDLAWIIGNEVHRPEGGRFDYYIQVDRNPRQGILAVSLVPYFPFFAGYLRDIATVYLPVQEIDGDILKFVVGGRINLEYFPEVDGEFSRDPFKFWTERNLDAFARHTGFRSYMIQPRDFPVSILLRTGFEKKEDGSYVRAVPPAGNGEVRSEVRDVLASLPPGTELLDENQTRDFMNRWPENFVVHRDAASVLRPGITLSTLSPWQAFEALEQGRLIAVRLDGDTMPRLILLRSEVRRAEDLAPVYDEVLAGLARAGRGPVPARLVERILWIIERDGSRRAAAVLRERARDDRYFDMLESEPDQAVISSYRRLFELRSGHPGYDEAASGWAEEVLAKLPDLAKDYFERRKTPEGAYSGELNYALAFPLDGSEKIRGWILKLLDTLTALQQQPRYGSRIHAKIAVLVTKEELRDPALKDFYKALGRSHIAKVIDLTSAKGAAQSIGDYLEQKKNALAYGVENYPFSRAAAGSGLRLVRSDATMESTFPVAVLLAQRLAEEHEVTAELLKNITDAIEEIVGFDGRGLHITSLAYEVVLKYTVDQFIGRMA